MPLVLILKSYVKIYPGWIDKAVLLPLVKSVFSYKMKEQEIKAFLGNASLKAMVSVHTYFYVCVSENENQFIFFPLQLLNMGLEVRDHVHEIEYLSLVAFVAREIHLALPSKSPYTRFTPQDLEMALSFQLKFGRYTKEAITGNHHQCSATFCKACFSINCHNGDPEASIRSIYVLAIQ